MIVGRVYLIYKVFCILTLICFLNNNISFSNPDNPDNPDSAQTDQQNLKPVIDRNIIYSPVGKRDPFESFIFDLLKADDVTNKNPLQRYDLPNLKLIGVMTGIPVPRAMVEDPTGKGWIVKVGTSIGKHFGKVKSIKSDSITVIEEYHDRFGKLTINEVEIYMGKKD